MKKGWGSQTANKKMRSTLIERTEGFVGPFYDPNNPQMVKIGSYQTTVFDEDDTGPFELSPEKRESRKYDTTVYIPFKNQRARDKSKKELVP
jgi:hypothetical protein